VTLLRLRSTKHGKVRFASHRDVARVWERSLRRSGVPMAYSEGFSPRAKISFGLALPTGSESDAEYIDIHVDDQRAMPCALDELPGVLTTVLPPGIEVTGIAVLDRGTPSLQQAVTSCVWDITVRETSEHVTDWSRRVLDAPSIVVTRQRKGKDVIDDLRPSILSLEVLAAPDAATAAGDGGGAILRAELGTQPRSLRPAELLDALGPGPGAVRFRRRQQWIEQDGARLEPLQVGAAPAPRSVRSAS
jgi:radical SAM-linked protein